MQNEPKFIPVSNLTPENIADTAQENRKSRLANAIHKMDHDSARHQWISVAAYYKALARGFAPGLELDDWLDAEKDYAETVINLYIAILEEERANAAVARQIHDLREKAGFTQRELAKIVGTTASVICRLENADYEGHSLAMLRRIAKALDRQVEISFVPRRHDLQPA